MNSDSLRISVVEPVSPAIEHARTMLFSPFNIGKWCIIGFSAWLASLGRPPSSGGGNQYRASIQSLPDEFHHIFEEGRQFVTDNITWIVPVGILLLMVGIAFALLTLWLSSRGRLMFLYCVAQNKAEVKNPWYRFAAHGNSLFLFRLVFGIVGFAILAGLGIFVGMVYWTTHASGFGTLSIVGMVTGGVLFLIVLILFGIVNAFTTDFVVPLMYLHTPSCTQAWRLLLDVVGVNQGRFILYLLFQILLNMAIGVIIIAAGCLTCGCACCFVGLPYIGTVAMLPILVFQRLIGRWWPTLAAVWLKECPGWPSCSSLAA